MSVIALGKMCNKCHKLSFMLVLWLLLVIHAMITDIMMPTVMMQMAMIVVMVRVMEEELLI